MDEKYDIEPDKCCCIKWARLGKDPLSKHAPVCPMHPKNMLETIRALGSTIKVVDKIYNLSLCEATYTYVLRPYIHENPELLNG